MFRSFLVIVLLVAGFALPKVFAQESPEALNVRASQLIDSTMASLNIRAERFNEELAKINAVKPLDVASIGKEVIPKNREKIKDFLNYLEVYRTLCAQQQKEIEDTVNAFKVKVPARYKTAFLKDFLDAYDLDQSTFVKYTQALTKVFMNMDAVLAFLDQSNVTTKDKKTSIFEQRRIREVQ